MRDALQRGAGGHETGFVERQATARQPARCLSPGGQHRGIAGQPRATGQDHRAGQQGRTRLAENRDAARRQRPRHAALQRGGMATHRLAAARDQRHPRGPVTVGPQALLKGQRQLDAARAGAHHHDVECSLRRQRQQRVQQAREVMQRVHEEALLAPAGDEVAVDHGFRVQRQQVVAGAASVRGLHAARADVHRHHAGLHQAHTGRAGQGHGVDLALRQRVSPGYEGWHPARQDDGRGACQPHHVGVAQGPAGQRLQQPAVRRPGTDEQHAPRHVFTPSRPVYRRSCAATVTLNSAGGARSLVRASSSRRRRST